MKRMKPRCDRNSPRTLNETILAARFGFNGSSSVRRIRPGQLNDRVDSISTDHVHSKFRASRTESIRDVAEPVSGPAIRDRHAMSAVGRAYPDNERRTPTGPVRHPETVRRKQPANFRAASLPQAELRMTNRIPDHPRRLAIRSDPAPRSALEHAPRLQQVPGLPNLRPEDYDSFTKLFGRRHDRMNPQNPCRIP